MFPFLVNSLPPLRGKSAKPAVEGFKQPSLAMQAMGLCLVALLAGTGTAGFLWLHQGLSSMHDYYTFASLSNATTAKLSLQESRYGAPGTSIYKAIPQSSKPKTPDTDLTRMPVSAVPLPSNDRQNANLKHGVLETMRHWLSKPASSPYAFMKSIEPQVRSVSGFIKKYNTKLSDDDNWRMAQAIVVYSHKYGVDYRLTTGVIAVESSFRSDAVSRSGAMGLGQLKPKTAQWLGVVNAFDPIDNIAGTARYISYLLSNFNGSVDQAIASYYQGQGTTRQVGIGDEAKGYLVRVNKAIQLI